MTFEKLRQEGNDYHLTNQKTFIEINSLEEYLREVFDFAYNMTFGGEGEHRGHRSGGQYGRKNGELFINTFQGKLAEFALFDLFNSNGKSIERPDLGMWKLGIWDSVDLIIESKHYNIKSTIYYNCTNERVV